MTDNLTNEYIKNWQADSMKHPESRDDKLQALLDDGWECITACHDLIELVKDGKKIAITITRA